MSEPSRSITYGNLLPTERYARPMAPATLPRFEWPSQWQANRMRCWHCRVVLRPLSTPTPTELIVAVDCWSCGRTLCELVPEGYQLGPVPMCSACCGRPATRRRLCDPCMEAQQQAARMRRQHEFRARERERLTIEEREARRQARNARRRSVAEGLTPEQREAVNAKRRRRRSERVGVTTR